MIPRSLRNWEEIQNWVRSLVRGQQTVTQNDNIEALWYRKLVSQASSSLQKSFQSRTCSTWSILSSQGDGDDVLFCSQHGWFCRLTQNRPCWSEQCTRGSMLWAQRVIVYSFGVMPLEVTPSPGAPPPSTLSSVSSHLSTSQAVSAHFKVCFSVSSVDTVVWLCLTHCTH